MSNFESRMLAMKAVTGKEYADTVLVDGHIVNVDACIIEKANVAIAGSRISRIGNVDDLIGPHTNIIHIKGILCPGFIDAHYHIDDSLLPPSIHARLAIPHGTLAIIEDPHEVANAAGPKAVEIFMKDCENALGKIFIMIPSSVPSVPSLETTPKISSQHARKWIKRRNVIGLAEVMDDAGIISERNRNVLRMINITLKERKIVDGHFSNCEGNRIQAYVAAGISTDHQCSTPEKVAEIVKRGAWAILNGGKMIFEWNGSTATLLDTIVRERMDLGHVMLCTDDRHAGDIKKVGLMDYNISKAIQALEQLEIDKTTAFLIAVRMATRNAAECYRLNADLGSIAPGKLADIVEVNASIDRPEDLSKMRMGKILIDGKLVAEDGNLVVRTKQFKYPSWMMNRVHIRQHFSIEDLRVRTKQSHLAKVRISQAWHDETNIERIQMLPVKDGCIQPDVKKDIVKIVVMERHGINGKIGIGFINGTGLQEGAIATTLSHDSHNLTAIGFNDDEIFFAIKKLIKMRGGMIVANNQPDPPCLSLPIAGIMTDDLEEAVAGQERVRNAARKLGLKPPLLRTFGTTLGLTAYPGTGTMERPKWTITDKGLVEYPTCKILDVIVDH
ncbi:MAG TPA: adenine deaminase C-terminal domain-containing protein [Candidatus Bathyarchaeia archaeon]|nr:adenine deaminase C-terminal domain-containing protein [Candidatus Bathyarchaeia archaeon]